MIKANITRIKEVEITNLWGKYDIHWELDPRVNILIGINGSGKTTVLNLIVQALDYKNFTSFIPTRADKAKITFNNQGIIGFKFVPKDKTNSVYGYPAILEFDGFPVNDNLNLIINVPHWAHISTFDMALRNKEVVEKLSDNRVKTELDFELHQLINEYIRYQLTLGKQVEKLFLEAEAIDVKAKREEIYGKKNLFITIVNQLFEKTGKVIDSDEQERMIFRQGDTTLTPYQMSSGEKQMLIILLKVLLQNNQPSILLMDEPESSLHLEWQEHLIDHILQLNEHIQIIIATHSPGIMMKGWLDKVTEIETITTVHQ